MFRHIFVPVWFSARQVLFWKSGVSHSLGLACYQHSYGFDLFASLLLIAIATGK